MTAHQPPTPDTRECPAKSLNPSHNPAYAPRGPTGSRSIPSRNSGTRRFPVVGDSMIDAAICDGDIVTVRKMDSADHGDIVAALLDDEATIKVLRRQGGRVWLMPRSPS
ncbi:LexA family protein [Streptomyces mirabilis]|uniref:LexA family protein n=1 Tax=Streptomyces mirabilis TaxID=68239 RepID=UPI003F5F4B8C